MQTANTNNLHAWLQSHWRVAKDSWYRLSSNGSSSLFTILMMGCVLSLPTSLWVLTKNADAASQDWQRQFSLSLYLSDKISEQQGQNLLKELLDYPLIERGEFLNREQSLAEFQQYSGFGKALELLADNPLPAVIILWPRPNISRVELDGFLAKLDARSEIDLAQADSEWLDRLAALIGFGRNLVRLMGLILALTVALVVANTIRYAIESRREEILVMKLIGAPDGFIQRPFLYSGTLYGLLSGIVACLGVVTSLNILEPHLQSLGSSYGQALELAGLSMVDGLSLIGLSALMGWLGAWHSVWRNLAQIEPE